MPPNCVPLRRPQRHLDRIPNKHTSNVNIGMQPSIQIPRHLMQRSMAGKLITTIRLTAITVVKGVCLAPEHVLKLIRCGCGSDFACKKGNCGWISRQVSCTIFVTVVEGHAITDSLSTNKLKKLMMQMVVCRIRSSGLWKIADSVICTF